MKFCLVTTFFPPEHFGGDAIAVANLANLLVEAGHSVDVVHCADSFELLRGTVRWTKVWVSPEARVHRLRSGWGGLSPLFTYLTGFAGPKQAELRRILESDFDIIHWHNLSLVAGAGAIVDRHAVQLCTLHDYWWICPTSLLFKYDGKACEKRECLRCLTATKRPPQLWRYTNLLAGAARHVDRFIAPSAFVRNKYAASELALDCTVLPHPAVAFGNTVSVEKADYYFYAGRLSEEKGIQTVLPLFGQTGRPFWIAGAGPYETALRSMAMRYDNIRFLGAVDHEELAPLYAAARATLLPSICYETFGLSVLESLQQKTPVIVSHYGAPAEIVSQTAGGRVYSSLRQLETILDEFDRNPEATARIGHFGYQGLEAYSPQRHLQLYLNVVDQERSRKLVETTPVAAPWESHGQPG